MFFVGLVVFRLLVVSEETAHNFFKGGQKVKKLPTIS